MKKLIKDTYVLDIFSLYLLRKGVLQITSFCKSFIRFTSIITKNLSFYSNKHNEVKREMTSSRETGGAAGIHIDKHGDNKITIKNKEMSLNRQNLEIKC